MFLPTYFPPDYFPADYFPSTAAPVVESPGPVIGGRFRLIEFPARPRVEPRRVDDDEAIIAAVALLIA